MDNPSKKFLTLTSLLLILTLILICPPSAYAQNQVTVTVRIEKPDKPLWQGTVTLTGGFTKDGKTFTEPTPLEALDKAALKGGFTYTATWCDKVFPHDYFIEDITVGSDSISNVGYCVNAVWPAYGVGYGWADWCPDLGNGDEIIFYDAGSGWVFPQKILKLTVSSSEVYEDEYLNVTVQEATILWQQFKTSQPYDNPWPNVTWSASEKAKIYVDGSYIGVQTDDNGRATISISNLSLGTHQVYAEKSDYIRSARVEILVKSSASGYTKEQRMALNEAEEILSSEGNVAKAYNLLLEKGIISSPLPPLPSSLLDRLMEIYGPTLERYPTLEGRIQLLYALGVETLSSLLGFG